MRHDRLIILVLLMHLYACTNYSDSGKVESPLIFKDQSTIDSLYKREQNDAIRFFVHRRLNVLSKNDSYDDAYLYNAIGRTYIYSYHHDSAVYYLQKAWHLAGQSKSIPLQAFMGADLLHVYNQSGVYKNEGDKLFHVLSNMQELPMPLNTKALLLDVMGEYACSRDMRGMSQFFLSKSEPIYEKLIADRSLQYMDSLHLGSHYIYRNRSGDVVKNKNDNILLLKKSRFWMGSNRERLAFYYSGMRNWYCNKMGNMDTAIIYQDSLISLMNATGLNLNDEVVSSKLEFSDYFFFRKRNYKLSQKYCDEAKPYLKGCIDPALTVYHKWMQADIYLKQGRYKRSVSILKSILPQARSFSYAEKLRVAESIATSFDKLGMLDSAIVYYKQIAPLTIEGYGEQQRNIQQEADTRYLNKIKQNKIEEQHRSLQYSRNQLLWLLLGMCLALFSMILLIVIYRNKRKTAQRLDAQNIQLSSLNNQLKEANETKSKLFGIISHDLRSPISQLYQLMKLQLPDSGIVIEPEEKEMLEQETHNATISLLDSMEDLLIWSKTQLQSFKPTETWVHLNEVIIKCRDLSQLQIRNKKIEILNAVEPSVMMKTDANFLLIILRNLIHNAINASPIQGFITISFEYLDDKQYCINIKNQGISFSQQDYLSALTNTQTSHFLKGGLGLQVVDELSRKIKMEIFFEEQESGGSSCIIKLNCEVRSKKH